MSEIAFKYSEDRVAKKIGASRGQVREIRDLHLQEGLDWKKIGREILLSESGLHRVGKLFGNRLSLDSLSPLEKNGAADKRHFKVLGIPFNQRMVLANESGDVNAEKELVDVGSNKTFRIGDEIEVGPHDAQQGIWQLLSKLPRDGHRPSVPTVSLRSPIQLFDTLPPDKL